MKKELKNDVIDCIVGNTKLLRKLANSHLSSSREGKAIQHFIVSNRMMLVLLDYDEKTHNIKGGIE